MLTHLINLDIFSLIWTHVRKKLWHNVVASCGAIVNIFSNSTKFLGKKKNNYKKISQGKVIKGHGTQNFKNCPRKKVDFLVIGVSKGRVRGCCGCGCWR